MDGSYGCCNFYGPVSTQQEYNTADYAHLARSPAALGNTVGRRRPSPPGPTTGRTCSTRPPTTWRPSRRNGQFAPGFAPTTSNGFVEGTSAQYTPMEPFDIAGLIAAAGGKANWIAKLNSLSSNIKHPTAANADFGNEPSIEIPWEYDYAGRPVQDPADGALDPAADLHQHPGRHRRQRRPGHDERLVRLVGARLLPGDPGHRRSRPGQPGVRRTPRSTCRRARR